MPQALRVAIAQSSIIPGGRLRVVLGITEVLNRMGIVPDLLTSALSIHTDDITTAYGQQPRARYRILPRVPGLAHEFATIFFNLILNRYASTYDLLISTNNSMVFLPHALPVINYIFYSRKARIMARQPDLHRPEVELPKWSTGRITRGILRLIYCFEQPHPNHRIICMTEFTRKALQQVYKIPPGSPTLYPPVDTTRFTGTPRMRSHDIVTVGRFSPEKRQKEQIEVASRLPALQFHLVGFSGEGQYLEACRNLVTELNAQNVHLYPNASFDVVRALLQSSRVFFHTLVNEPFGLTTAQAIAAGCLPIVHDSGGQREIVTDQDLRYTTLETAVDKLRQAQEWNDAEVRARVDTLQQHVTTNFDESVFLKGMHTLLSDYIASP